MGGAAGEGERGYRNEFSSSFRFACCWPRSAVEKILLRHAPGNADLQSADFLIVEAEGIRKFVSKLVAFEKSQQKVEK